MATLQNREIWHNREIDFREKRGTVDAIVSLMEKLKVEIKSHPEKVTQCILLDWKKKSLMRLIIQFYFKTSMTWASEDL